MSQFSRSRLFSALFGVAVACAMLALWSTSLLTSSMPEMRSSPWSTYAHLAADLLTAGLLLVSGVGLFLHRHWARPLHLVALGMLIYAALQGGGSFIQQRQPLPAALFALLALMAAVDAAVTIRRLVGRRRKA